MHSIVISFRDERRWFSTCANNEITLLSAHVITRPRMSSLPSSRVTLADVIALISRSDFTDRQKQEMRSAVRTVARILGGEPADIAADPPGLRRRLETVAPQAQGMSRGRWANVRSLLLKGVALSRPMMAGRSAQPILPEWQSLMSGLPMSRSIPLAPALRFFSTARPAASGCHRSRPARLSRRHSP
jgi:hypothetical protein